MTEEKKPRKKRKDPRIEEEYFEEIEVTCPATGKLIKQKVKITRYKAVGEKKVGNKGVVEEIEDDIDIDYKWDLTEIEESDD